MGYESYELQTNDIYGFQDYGDQYGIQVKSPFADSSGYMETAKVCYYTEQGIYTCVGTDGQSGEVGICVGGCPRGPIIENHNFHRGGGRIGGFGRGGW